MVRIGRPIDLFLADPEVRQCDIKDPVELSRGIQHWGHWCLFSITFFFLHSVIFKWSHWEPLLSKMLCLFPLYKVNEPISALPWSSLLISESVSGQNGHKFQWLVGYFPCIYSPAPPYFISPWLAPLLFPHTMIHELVMRCGFLIPKCIKTDNSFRNYLSWLLDDISSTSTIGVNARNTVF